MFFARVSFKISKYQRGWGWCADGGLELKQIGDLLLSTLKVLCVSNQKSFVETLVKDK